MASSVFPISSDASLKTISQPLQKKLLTDILECIIQLKSDFFENHQPISDDSLVLQKFCAKLEHLIQVGMKERVSLLGRKKDYWDYFCECLGSAKGSNDGIKYVKSLAENKTSLGKGRAFIRFCLVHQRLADTLQQCIVHDKTMAWFLPSSIMMNKKECQGLINSLYDLNSMHFDLSPRGYDLDATWPSFANRKTGGSGSWNVPLSRRSSITSMDTVSQISMSFDSAEVEKQAKELEAAQSVKSELIGQIGALQQEKEQVSQSAWTLQGELQALQQQLSLLQSQHSVLQERYMQLDVEHVKLKLEKDRLEQAHSNQLKDLNEKFREEEAKRVSQLESEEDIWKKEVKAEGKRRKKEIDRLQKELEVVMKDGEDGKILRREEEKRVQELMKILNMEMSSMPSDSIENCLGHVVEQVKQLQLKLQDSQSDRLSLETLQQEKEVEKEKRLAYLESYCLSLEQQLEAFHSTQNTVQNQLCSSEEELSKEKLASGQLKENVVTLELKLAEREKDIEILRQDKDNVKKELKNVEKNKENLSQECSRLKESLDTLQDQNNALNTQCQGHVVDMENLVRNLEEKDIKLSEMDNILVEARTQLEQLKNNSSDIQQILSSKEEELAALKQNQSSECNALLGKLNSVEELLKDKSKELCECIAEREKLRAESVASTELAASSNTELEKLKNLLTEAESKVTLLDAEVSKLKEEVGAKSVTIDINKTQADIVQTELASVYENLSSMQSQNEVMNTKFREVNLEKEQLKVDLISYKTEIENLKREISGEKKSMMRLVTESEGMKRSEGEKDEKILSLVVEIEQLKRQHEEQDFVLQNKIAEFDREIVENGKEIASLKLERERISNELEKEKIVQKDMIKQHKCAMEEMSHGANDTGKILRETISKLQLELDDTKRQHDEEVMAFTDRIGHLELQLSEKEKLLASKCLDYEKIIEELKRDNAELESSSLDNSESITKLSSEVSALAEERDHLLMQTDAALEDAQQIKSQLTETSEQLALSYAQLENMTTEKNEFASRCQAMMEELSKLETDKDQLHREVEGYKAALKAAEDESQEKLSQKREVELKLEELQAQLLELSAEKSELATQLEGYQSQSDFSTKVLEESLVESREALELLKTEKMELQEKLEFLASENTELKSNIVKLEADVKALQKFEQQKEIFESEIKKIQLELEKEKLNNENLNEEISALQFQLSSEQILKTELLQTSKSETVTSAELKTQISDLEIIIEQLETECKGLQKSKETDSEQIEDIQKQLNVKKDECAQLDGHLLQLQTVLKEEQRKRGKLESDLTLLRRAYKKDVEEKDAEIKMLQSDNDQIKKQIIKLTRDKDSLWHKTDQLVTEHKRKVGERWQDNAQVSHCPQCKTEFSMFVRRHHCRLCGRIYCRSCSDFWMDSPHSSKKVRVCKPCFDHQQNLGSSLLSSSMLDNESDEDEEKEQNKTSENRAGVISSSSNQTDEGKIKERPVESCEVPLTEDEPSIYDDINHEDNAEITGNDNEEDIDEAMFQIVSQEEVLRSINEYTHPKLPAAVPQNMTSSMLLYADELEAGQVNRQNEVWIKAGKTFAVPIDIGGEGTVLHWEFTSQPKDIVFSVNYRADEEVGVADAEEIVAPCKCDSHKQTVVGELNAKKPGIYTLLFDNTYSRMTSKKIHYILDFKKQP